MVKTRKIVLVLGNGFDLDRELETSYEKFWESDLCPKNYPAPIIRHLNSKLSGRKGVRWYDLENELYFYALNGDKTDVVDKQELDLILSKSDYELTISTRYSGIDDVLASLSQKGYVEISGPLNSARVPFRADFEDPVAIRDRKALALIKERLCEYLKRIENVTTKKPKVSSFLLRAMNICAGIGDNVSIYTFNYTHPQCFNTIDSRIPIHYVHGDCENKNIIIGTRDDLKLSNDYDFLQKAMDPAFNPPDLVHNLIEADEVVFFGHSLGENDSQYFSPFFKKLIDIDHPTKKDITFFTYDHEAQNDIKRSLQKMTDGNLSVLYSIHQPHIIKNHCLLEDLPLFHDFITKHNFASSVAEDIIGLLLEGHTESVNK